MDALAFWAMRIVHRKYEDNEFSAFAVSAYDVGTSNNRNHETTKSRKEAVSVSSLFRVLRRFVVQTLLWKFACKEK
jgi:hypothetical protein